MMLQVSENLYDTKVGSRWFCFESENKKNKYKPQIIQGNLKIEYLDGHILTIAEVTTLIPTGIQVKFEGYPGLHRYIALGPHILIVEGTDTDVQVLDPIIAKIKYLDERFKNRKQL